MSRIVCCVTRNCDITGQIVENYVNYMCFLSNTFVFSKCNYTCYEYVLYNLSCMPCTSIFYDNHSFKRLFGAFAGCIAAKIVKPLFDIMFAI